MAQTDEPAGGRFHAAYLLGVLLMAFFMSYMDRQIITLLLPSLKLDLGVSDTQVSMVQGLAFASAYVLAGLPMGWIVDRANRRNLIVTGVLVWSLGTMACGMANSYAHLFIARMVVGLGESALSPACVSLLADYFRPEHRGRAIAVVLAGAPLGAASSLFLGGMLLTSLAHGQAPSWLTERWAPWQIVFLIMSLPGIVVAFLVALLKEPARRGDHGEGGAIAAQPANITGFFWKNRKTIVLFYGMVGCVSAVSFSVASWGPTVLMRIYAMEPTRVGALYGGILLAGGVVGGLFSGALSDGFVRRWPLRGRVLVPICLFPIEIAAQTTFLLAGSSSLAVGALAVVSFSGAVIGASFYPAIQDMFPNQLRGRATALFALVGSLVGMGVGPTLVALITDRVFHDEMMLQSSVGIVAVSGASLAFLMSLALPRRYALIRERLCDEPSLLPHAQFPAKIAR